MNYNFYSILRLVCLNALFISILSCTEENEPDLETEEKVILSDSNDILSFNLDGLDPVVEGTISGSSIEFLVPFETNITSLSTFIEISESATIDPNSGTSVDFSESVQYTVTAEDGSENAYTVTVEKDITPISVNPITGTAISGNIEVQRGEFIRLTGSNFVVNSSSITFVSDTESIEMNILIEEVDLIAFVINHETPMDEYILQVASGGDVFEYGQSFVVDYASPVIDSFSPTEVIPGQEFVVTGQYFSENPTNLEIALSNNGTETILEIISSTSTTITAKVPEETQVGSYTIKVSSNGYSSFHNVESIEIIVNPDTPIISSIDQSSYTLGNTMTFTGTNLGLEGESTTINFTVFTSGSDQMVIGTVNSEGTEMTYTIPDSFDAGRYTISVTVGGLVSEVHDGTILINN